MVLRARRLTVGGERRGRLWQDAKAVAGRRRLRKTGEAVTGGKILQRADNLDIKVLKGIG